MLEKKIVKVHTKVRASNKGWKYLVFFYANGEKEFVHFSNKASDKVIVGQDIRGFSEQFNVCFYEIKNIEINKQELGIRIALINEQFDLFSLYRRIGGNLLLYQNTILHVHHKFYVKSWLPWDYPNDALITFCSICHDHLHRTQSVKVYKENRDYFLEELDYEPCTRCSGSGYLQEYDHVQNGVCFRCGGQGFEEDLI
jgi:hypothetical protein